VATVAFQIFASDDPAKLKRTSSQKVAGPLWVSIAGRPFPQAGWLDFPIIALADWTQKCLELKAPGDSALLVFFFQGLKRMRVEQLEGELVRITGVDNGVDGASCIASNAHLWSELGRVGHQVLAQCSKRGWPGNDWNRLWQNLEKYRHPAPRN
jgi:hypothetical protein